MISKYLDMSPPAAAAIKAGCPVVALETAYFCSLPYPLSLQSLLEAEQGIWAKDCVPCSLGVLDGRLKAGMTSKELEALCRCGATASRVELPRLCALKGSAALQPSAALALAVLAGIEPVVLPGFSDALENIDALASTRRLAFCGPLTRDNILLFLTRGIPVFREEPETLSDAFLVLRDLGGPEGLLVPCGGAVASMTEPACAAALAVKRKTSFT